MSSFPDLLPSVTAPRTGLDATRPSPRAMLPSAATAAGEAGDDDVEEGDDPVDDGGENRTYAVDNGH